MRWDNEESEYKIPDKSTRECCKTVILGGMDSLIGTVHVGDFHGNYKISMNFCPECGRSIPDYMEEVIMEHMTQGET